MSDSADRPAWLIPVAEMPPLPPEAIPDRRPLSQDEADDLLRRINATGGAHIRLTGREEDHIDALPPVRDTEQVRLLRLAVAGADPSILYIAGIADSLAWAYGEVRGGPATGRPADHDPPTCSDLESEESVARHAARGDADKWDAPLPRPQEYMVAVEHTLMWLVCRTDDPPWDLPGVEGGHA